MDTDVWTTQLVVYCDQSAAISIALRMLVAEKQIPCAVQIMRGDLPQHLRQINRTGQLPFLVDKMLALTDIPTILKYLEERFPCNELLPCDPKVRAQIRELSSYIRSYYDKTPEEQQSLIHDLAECLEHARRPHDWLLGDEFTLVDVMAAPLLWTAESHSLPLTLYRERLMSRPSFQAAIDFSQDLHKEVPAYEDPATGYLVRV